MRTNTIDEMADVIAAVKAGETVAARELGWQTNTILNWMASEGVIPKGEYRINICW